MSDAEVCTHGNTAPKSVLKNLHESQAGTGRHKCTVCAYNAGYSHGIAQRMGLTGEPPEPHRTGALEKCAENSTAPKLILKSLPESQAGSGRHRCAVCAYQQGHAAGLAQQILEPQNLPADIALATKPFPDVDDESLSVKEGRLRLIQHLRRERNPQIVTAKKRQVLDKTGCLECEACGFDFKKSYGELGEGFSEAHHKKPLSSLKQPTETRLEDLAILCSNCHRMIHRTKPMMSVAEFKKRILNKVIP